MKIFSLAIAMLSIFSLSAMAEEGKFSFGGQGGLVFSDYRVENPPFGRSYDNENGFIAGVFSEIGVWTVTLRPEVNYVEQGYTVSGMAEVTQKYLEIPVLLKVNPFGDFFVSPFLLLGPAWWKHLKTDVKVLGATTSYTNTADDWNISGVAGAGIEFNVADRVSLNLQGRYNFGFRDVDTSNINLKARSIYALGGVGFQF